MEDRFNSCFPRGFGPFGNISTGDHISPPRCSPARRHEVYARRLVRLSMCNVVTGAFGLTASGRSSAATIADSFRSNKHLCYGRTAVSSSLVMTWSSESPMDSISCLYRTESTSAAGGAYDDDDERAT